MIKYYTVYKVTNKINGKVYIGTHKTNTLDDNYMGSGTYLIHSQNKHGIENFEKEILHVFDNSEEMFAKEKELVTIDFIAESNTYNLKIGGFGGWDHINSDESFRIEKNSRAMTIANSNGALVKAQAKLKWLRENDPDWVETKRAKISESLSKHYETNDGSFKGKSHTDETKRKIGASNSIASSGTRNSQYGTRWIHSLEEQISKKISKTIPLPNGWLEGRKMKFV